MVRRLDPITFRVLAEMARRVKLASNGRRNVFEFTKAEFIKTYRRLLRARQVPFRKYETVFRNLRRAAENRWCVEYADERGGRYRAWVPCIEADPRYTRLLAAGVAGR